MLCIGCGYGEVSPATYQYAKALYSVTNRQAADSIDEVAEKIAAAETAGEITAHERGYLDAILEDARAERWKEASQAARQMMQEQVK